VCLHNGTERFAIANCNQKYFYLLTHYHATSQIYNATTACGKERQPKNYHHHDRIVILRLMKSFLTILILGVFLVYSQGMLVMWCLYFVEKQDIIMYYCNEHDTTNGASYVHKLCDAQSGEHTGALALIKVVDNHTVYAKEQTTYRFKPEHRTVKLHIQPQNCYLSPHPNKLFRPPCFS